LQVLIQNALQPATIEEVFLYEMLQRAIVLVKEDQLSLAIGRRGQNVRLASKLVEWDIEIMTADELGTAIEKAESQFMQLPGVQPELVEALIEQGFLSYEDIAVLTPAELCEMGGMDEETAMEMIAFADEGAAIAESQPKAAKPREGGAPAAPVSAPTAAERFDSLFAPAEEGQAVEGEAPTIQEEAALEEQGAEEVPQEAVAEAPAAEEGAAVEYGLKEEAPVAQEAASEAAPADQPASEGQAGQ
jgi:N utilization substance protein A